MTLTGLIAGALLLMGASESSTALSVSAFRDRYAAAAVAATKGSTEVIDERTFKVSGGPVSDLTVNVDGAYAAYRKEPTEIDAIIARYVALIVVTGSESSEPIEQLVAIVRPSDYVTRSLPTGSSGEDMLAARPLAGDLSIFLAVDSPETIRTAGKKDLDRWRVTESAAWTYAFGNLKQRIGPLGMLRLGDENGASGLGAESGLAPSILLDPGFCGPKAPRGISGQVVLLYAKDFLLFALPEDRVQTERFWAAVQAGVKSDSAISQTPLTCRDGRWIAVPINMKR